MSITQEQYDALEPGDRVRLRIGASDATGTVVGAFAGRVWVQCDGSSGAWEYDAHHIATAPPPARSVAWWINLYSDRCISDPFASRQNADDNTYGHRTHVITIYSDGTTTTEAVS